MGSGSVRGYCTGLALAYGRGRKLERPDALQTRGGELNTLARGEVDARCAERRRQTAEEVDETAWEESCNEQ